MLTIINCLSIVISIAVVFCLVKSHKQTQRALIWWNSRQLMRMYQQGEMIQNGLLQESFVIRRHLEVSLLNPSVSQQQQEKYYLATIEKFHHSLKELSDYLFPAHIDDSLPLAIRHILAKWESQIPKLNFQIELPNDWHHESVFISSVILIALEDLLQIISPTISHKLSLSVSLKSQKSWNELTVNFSGIQIFNKSNNSNLSELDYLRRAFIFLTLGECFYQKNNNDEIWYFRWRSPENTKHT
jgi:hypothetical protein